MSILTLRRHSRGLGLSPRRRAAKGAAPPGIVTDGLVAEWPFDEGTGQVVTDHSGSGFHGQFGPTAGVDADEPAWAAYGVDCIISAVNNSVRLASAGTLGISGGAPRTLISVVQGNRVDANTDYPGLGSWAGSGTLGERFWFGPAAGSNTLRLAYGTGVNQSTFSGLDMVNATWHFTALTLSGNNVNTAVAYLDGASVAATTNQTLNTTGNFAITGRNGGDSGNFQWSKHAYQMVYNRALSASEIAQNRTVLAAILAGRGITLP